jgi:norsolorinic acid ketoreductase
VHSTLKLILTLETGLVATDMNTKSGIDMSGFPAAISPEQSAAEFADLIVKATRAEDGGKFLGQGSEEPLPW